jgi:hypothetical protein
MRVSSQKARGTIKDTGGSIGEAKKKCVTSFDPLRVIKFELSEHASMPP